MNDLHLSKEQLQKARWWCMMEEKKVPRPGHAFMDWVHSQGFACLSNGNWFDVQNALMTDAGGRARCLQVQREKLPE